jgi:molybdopterin molybdotransferase
VETLTATDLPDIIVTTGGTGHSERDFARSSAVEAGFETIFDHVDIRPGRNMFAARRGTTLLIGLPGPPVAVFACFHAVLLPALRRMRGLSDREPILGRVDEGVSAKPGGTWVVLCKLVHRGTDILVTPLSGKNAPPMLAMGTAHGVAVLGGGESVLPGGRIEISSTLF